MKILFVTVNDEDHNKIYRNTKISISEVADVTYWGPGFVSNKELKSGVRKKFTQGNYDVIILDYLLVKYKTEHLNLDDLSRNVFQIYHDAFSDYEINDALRYADNIILEISEIDAIKIILWTDDTFNFSNVEENVLQNFINAGFFLWSIGSEFSPVFDENCLKNGWGASNRYHYFALNNIKNIISCPLPCIGEEDFYEKCITERNYDVTVPGNMNTDLYPERAKMMNLFKKAQYKIFDEYGNRNFHRQFVKKDKVVNSKSYGDSLTEYLYKNLKMVHPYLDIFTTKEAIMTWHEKFNVGLRNSKIAYIDGGVPLQIVQKFVEAPSSGCLVITVESSALGPFGFKNGDNIVVVNEDNVIDICNELLKNPDKMRRIAKKGQSMVFDKHRPVHHGRCILSSIESINSGNFWGSYWKDGNFCFI